MTATGYATGLRPRAAAGERAYRVVWLGERPWWLDTSDARDEIDDVEPGAPSRLGSLPLVVHATAAALPTLQRASRDRLVADLCGATRLDRAGARVARAASVVLVDDPDRLRLLGRGSRPTWSLLRAPLDLAEHAPLSLLRERRDPELKRFRRLHRVSPHTILYVGPYRREGGWLHLVLEAATALRRRYDDLVVAALPDGPVDRRYRDACERQAMSLGHRAIVEWQSPPQERALWYALASVVCAGGAEPAVLSAAAGAPAISIAAEPTVPEALAPELIDAGALTARLDALLADASAAQAVGAARRRAAEAEVTPAAAARRVRALWSGLATSG